MRQGASHIGELQAWDMNSGQKAWTHKFTWQNWGPILTTGGGLVFLGGTNDRNFRAFDAKSGSVLWEFKTNSGVTGVPSTYEVDGVQLRRRDVRLGRGRAADAGAAGHDHRHQDRRAPGRRGVGVRRPGLAQDAEKGPSASLAPSAGRST